MWHYLQGSNNPNDSGFLIRNDGGQKVSQHCQELKEKNRSPRILSPVNIPFRNEGKDTEKTTVPQTGETDEYRVLWLLGAEPSGLGKENLKCNWQIAGGSM